MIKAYIIIELIAFLLCIIAWIASMVNNTPQTLAFLKFAIMALVVPTLLMIGIVIVGALILFI